MNYVNGNKPQSEFTAAPDKYPQKRFNPKPCRKCGKVFQPASPAHLYCSDDCKDAASAEKYLKRRYNLSEAEYTAIADQQGEKCAICHGTGFKMQERHKSELVVDHCHETGKVRGLLCHNCNRALGLFHDNKEALLRAIEYLEGATTIPKGSTLKRVEARDPFN